MGRNCIDTISRSYAQRMPPIRPSRRVSESVVQILASEPFRKVPTGVDPQSVAAHALPASGSHLRWRHGACGLFRPLTYPRRRKGIAQSSSSRSAPEPATDRESRPGRAGRRGRSPQPPCSPLSDLSRCRNPLLQTPKGTERRVRLPGRPHRAQCELVGAEYSLPAPQNGSEKIEVWSEFQYWRLKSASEPRLGDIRASQRFQLQSIQGFPGFQALCVNRKAVQSLSEAQYGIGNRPSQPGVTFPDPHRPAAMTKAI
jgi:hypothetical protein